MIKLLKKEDIAKKEAEDKAREIQEGIKISRKVDSLRDLQAKEETNLEKYRSETLASIGKEIAEMTEYKANLSLEIGKLEAKKSMGLAEVERERKKLETRESELNRKQELLNSKSLSVELARKDIEKSLQNAADELLRAETHKEEALRFHKEANEEKKASAKLMSKAKEREIQANQMKANVDNIFSQREAEVSQRERLVVAREEANGKTEKELENERIFLADQRRTLEVEFRRLKQK